jgi:hypothetical protein
LTISTASSAPQRWHVLLSVISFSPTEEKLGREVNVVVYPIAEVKQKVREDHYFVKTVLEGEKIFLIGDEGEL